FQAEDGILDRNVTGVQTCALPISWWTGNVAKGMRCISLEGVARNERGTSMTSSMGASFDDDNYLPPEEPGPEYGPEPPESFDGPGQSFPRDNYGGGRRKYGKRDEVENPRRYGQFRQPPSDKDAEQGVLGAMLLSPSSVIEVIDEVDPEDFYYPAHQLIYSAMLDLYSDGTDIDPVIV